MISPLLASKAYAAVQNIGMSPPKGAQGGASGLDDGQGFGDLVKTAMSDMVDTSRKAEAQMIAHTKGKAEMVDVVTAVASAQASLQTMMAVRDQVISAYQQVMNMPV